MKRPIAFLCVTLVLLLCVPFAAWADEAADEKAYEEAFEAEDAAGEANDIVAASGVTLSSDNLAATLDGCPFALGDFTRANAGSNQLINDDYFGYTYFIGKKPSDMMYIVSDDTVVVYVNRNAADAVGLKIDSTDDQESLRTLIEVLGKANESGSRGISDGSAWYYTDEEAIEVDGVVYSFDRELSAGMRYDCVIGKDGTDITDISNKNYVMLTHACFATLVSTEDAVIVDPPSRAEKIRSFFEVLDWSPLVVTLKTTFTSIVFIFVLGLAAAYLCLQVSPRMRDILDTVFTIPMVLPPTVCGFLLLLLLGNKTPIGQWFNSVGFPLVFSWPATVIAATVVAFPLMYRSARGAFENLDNDMLDAARTLGWGNARVFFKLMLPLSWSSIAAGTVLSFARALGEYGATLFLAGNYVGITRTIPISIYFYWKIGRTDIALFWTGIILVFSFIVILFINLWSQHTTRYRKGVVEE